MQQQSEVFSNYPNELFNPNSGYQLTTIPTSSSSTFKIVSIVGIVVGSTLIITGLAVGLGVYFGTKSSSSTSVTTTSIPTITSSSTTTTSNNCGQQSISPSISGSTLNRIINGDVAVQNSWPWMVSLRMYTSTTITTHYCGGVLINTQYVLTAAHCLYNHSASEMAVIVGVNNAYATYNASTVYYASSILYHPDYTKTSSSIVNDIGIMKLQKAVTLGTTVALICLPESSSSGTDILNKNTVLTGWGSITGGNSASDDATDLRQTTLKVVNGNSICSSVNYNTSSQYCAYGPVNNSNACYGDSGGPLMYYTNSKWYSYGIVSFVQTYSNASCNPYLPSFYTSTAFYLDWIASAVSSLV